ncbi:VOC family protein [Thalassotalea profundi]|uniref:VOC domain-containing protein n=1 Tax=Thalassotalea profundi TaxID=2036687 RepID=A0ABQ3IQ54_9GAMM|nr:VOC family protein [Thalassotalea profundi]GHE91164.1 hypothetical protein GCM10011501_20820 [Thalassotalea profundi]
MNLGAFSISLAVKDIHLSKQFYQNLGFTIIGGDESQNWLIMKNGNHIIGLFEGMFDKNMMTFNPGWDQDSKALNDFDDIRHLQKQLKEKGVKITNEVDENTTGPANFVIIDPDGNPILIDQHV